MAAELTAVSGTEDLSTNQNTRRGHEFRSKSHMNIQKEVSDYASEANTNDSRQG